MDQANNRLIQHFIAQMQAIQSGKPWIGNSYAKVLDGLGEDQMFIRPAKLKSVAAILSHLTLWREEAILKIQTGTGSKTDACPENWLPDNDLDAQGWQAIKLRYDRSHAQLIALLNDKDDSFLQQEYYDTDFKGNYTYQWMLDGILQHDIYHLGQLAVIVKHLKMD
ncbi:DinB family protein [Gilvibacter sediminis]|uniref:DinB family protein n=1 Tax=Gilvibacter sediminis TaxID=379071 RepID=UPI002350A7DD|nr:DinB family protein [Gilvibacter sediminis]MDC7996542.1 DinB family protein [Gilvibacter sediminis]